MMASVKKVKSIKHISVDTPFEMKFEKYIYYPFNDNYGKFVRTADLLAALIECYLEISTGNQNSYFVNSFKKLKEEINDISPLDVSEILKEIEDSSSIHL